MAYSFSYATPGSGHLAEVIGWFNFGTGFSINPGQTITDISATMSNGVSVTFDLELATVEGTSTAFHATAAPADGQSSFGLLEYTGLTTSNVLLLSDLSTGNSSMSLYVHNIRVVNAQDDPLTNYVLFVSDGQKTSAYLPEDLVVEIQWSKAGLRQGVAIGFLPTEIQVYKNITERKDPSDQFDLIIAGTPADTATTTGSATGMQSVHAMVSALDGHTYTIDEAMAAGSVTPLTGYDQVVTAVNLTPGGTTPTVGTLPIEQTVVLGDMIQYTILNIADAVFTKTVTPEYAQPGDLLTYTIVVPNPDTVPLKNVVVTDPTPAGAIYMGNLVVSGSAYTGTNPASGITLTSIPANTTATIQWQVQVNTTAPITNPVVNVGNIEGPGLYAGSTNAAITTIHYADLTSKGNFIKTASPTHAQLGSIVTYTLTLKNTGTVEAQNIVIHDSPPAGTTYVPGSLAGNVGFTGDPTTAITLTTPLAAGDQAIFTFQVLIGHVVPEPNPIKNKASVQYTFTVDPLEPNGASHTGVSNTTTVTVSQAIITTSKTADKSLAYLDDIITYQIALTNHGNSPANQVEITDQIPNGTTYIPGSLTVSAAYTGSPETTINLTDPIDANETVAISFKVQVTQMPNPNPMSNTALVHYTYTVDPMYPDGVSVTSTSDAFMTSVLANNFSQQVADIIQSIALQEAALAAIANAEGSKIQAIVARPDITPQQLLCANKSVQNTLDLINLLTALLKQKLNAIDCQINPNCT